MVLQSVVYLFIFFSIFELLMLKSGFIAVY